MPQTCPNPRLGSLDFTLPLAPASHHSTTTELVSQSPCIRSSKDKLKVTLEARKAQENATSDNVSISASTLPSPASYLESCESKELHESLDISIFQNSYFNLYRSIVNLQYCINISCMGNQFPYTYTCIHCFLGYFPIQVITDY